MSIEFQKNPKVTFFTRLEYALLEIGGPNVSQPADTLLLLIANSIAGAVHIGRALQSSSLGGIG